MKSESPNSGNRKGRLAAGALLGSLALASAVMVGAQVAPTPVAPNGEDLKLSTLQGVPVPEPRQLGEFVKNRQMAIALGKALFWDQNLGSDGRTACASCHFQAGADNRVKNQIDPNLARVDGTMPAFDRMPSGGAGGPNYTLNLRDFPTYRLANPDDRESAILYQTRNVIGSQGVFATAFNAAGYPTNLGGVLTPTLNQVGGLNVGGLLPILGRDGSGTKDNCDIAMDTYFMVHGTNTRRVTGRNSPPVVNAVFNHRNFWDGRANNVFNGQNPWGDRDPDAGVWVTNTAGGVTKTRVALENSSLASQAVGPVNSEFEMACANRVFPNVGMRLLERRALAAQQVAADDSVLGGMRPITNSLTLGLLPSPGLRFTYAEMVRAAFQDKYWNSAQSVTMPAKSPGGTPVTYTQMQANFALFFGLAVQMYEATLVSDQTPLDEFLKGNTNALTAQEKRGLQVFLDKGKCINCHNGPQLSNAATPRLLNKEFVEYMPMGFGTPALYDGGYYNIGVRPTGEDLALGALDPWGNPLSFTRQYKNQLAGGQAVDRFPVDTCKFETNPCQTPPANVRDAVDGAFKTSHLRNIELTGPYLHNGSVATLEQLVEFYNRGGNVRSKRDANGNRIPGSDTSGWGPNPSNLDADIQPLGLTVQERADLVAFMKRPLTDQRVAWERAPFDHPQLLITNGHTGNQAGVVRNSAGVAQDQFRELPMVGRNGRSTAMGPLRPFHLGLAP